MEREWLAAELEAGRSIEAIAREVGRHPSTVAYRVHKHGLSSEHARKHRARGGIERERLKALARDGLSITAIGERLGMSSSTVRHWLRRYDLSTPRARRSAETAAAGAAGLDTVTASCTWHGVTAFGRKSDGGYRCLKCRSEAVVARRRRVKERLIAEAGGRCEICGYDRSAAASSSTIPTRVPRRSASPTEASPGLWKRP